MKRLRLLTIAVALMAFMPSFAWTITPMREVRDMAVKSATLTVEQDLYVEGFIISKAKGCNNEVNEQVHFASLKNHDLSTGYIESVTGDVGFRINFASRGDVAKFPRYAKVVLSLKGTTLVCEKPCRVTIKDLSDANIVKLTQCSAEDLPRKVKYISEITDDDVYTYVTLRDIVPRWFVPECLRAICADLEHQQVYLSE